MTPKWLFFDVGTTLIDETKAFDHRIRDAIAGTDVTFEQFNEKRKFFAMQRHMKQGWQTQDLWRKI